MTSRGHVISKAPTAVRESRVKSYSFHTQSSLMSLMLEIDCWQIKILKIRSNIFSRKNEKEKLGKGSFDCKDSDPENERWSTFQRRSFSAWKANFCAGTARDWDIGLVSIIILTSLFRRARGGVWEEVVIIDYRAEAIFISLSGLGLYKGPGPACKIKGQEVQEWPRGACSEHESSKPFTAKASSIRGYINVL